MKIKLWQIVVIVIGLLAGGVSLAITAMKSDDMKVNSILFLVDVESGDLYRVNLEKLAVTLPAFHPKTKRLTLVRINKNDKGAWVVGGRDLSLLAQLDKAAEIKAINPETGELIGAAKSPVEYVPTY